MLTLAVNITDPTQAFYLGVAVGAIAALIILLVVYALMD